MSKFSKDDIDLAVKVQSEYGVPASVTLAQYALESGYGKYTVGNNNYFNIKGDGRGGYRDYDSKEQSFMDYGALLATSRYTSKTKDAKSVREYVQGIKDAGYAEDPQYVGKVMRIISSGNLHQYDSLDYTGDGYSGSDGTMGLTWWGDVVRVVLVLLVIAAGAVLMVTSLGSVKNNIVKGD